MTTAASLQPSPWDRLGPELQQLCDHEGVQAGIGPQRVRGGAQAPALCWAWWATKGMASVSGFAPSVEAARLDVRAGLRRLR